MGFAELLVQLGVRYGSDPSFEIARQVMAFVNRESTTASYELALERGAFPEWSTSKYATPMEYPDWFERHTGQRPGDWPGGFPLRNHSTTSIAPTGTTSIVGNTSGGCEPLFNVVYFRNVAQDVRGGEPLVDFDDYFFDVLDANGIDPDEIADEARELLAEDAFEGPASLSIPDAIADLFVTAGDVSAEAHVRMQAAFQQHVDAGISKTVNFPHSATRDDVDRAFHLALELGCKGVTVYRDRSRRVQVLTTRPGEPVGSAGRPQETQCCPI
jgi:ribonucleoside-diphosphate reductase alpha chain